MHTLSRLITTLSLGLAIAAAVAACEDEPDLEDYCANKEHLTASCAGFAHECEEAPCFDHCTSLGEAAADFSGACGELWIDTYECFASMSCDGVELWRTAQRADTFNYPCGPLESEFRATCPGVPLYSTNN